jgi:cytochrome b561
LTKIDAGYDLVTRILHWTVAALIIALLCLGWYMVDLSYYHPWYNTSLEWHKALGMVALAAGVVMLCWTIGRRAPAPLASMAAWERWSARAMHGILLAMMVVIPATGYIISTAAGKGIAVFGWFEVPAVLPSSEGLRDLAITLHYYLAYITVALVLLHGAAALKHQFVDRDGTPRRMI